MLLAYLVDHVSIHTAFGICSAVSVFLVVSYLRLVVGTRFATREAALAQFIYLVAFSYAFFLKGFTGLAITIGSIVTLFVVMQATGRIRWKEKFMTGQTETPQIQPEGNHSPCTVGASACGTKHLRQRASYLSEAPTATRSTDSKVRCE